LADGENDVNDPKETSGQRLLKFDSHFGFLRFGSGRYRPGTKTPNPQAAFPL
jgi:hypothetical protein